MKNIFENAYFGKPYKTKSGRKALYLGDIGDGLYSCVNEDTFTLYNYLSNGQETMFEHQGIKDSSLNIVSEWQESIDEDKINAKACVYTRNLELNSTKLRSYAKQYYKAGYRQGWEDKK